MTSGLWHPNTPPGYCPWAEGSIRCDKDCSDRGGCILFGLIGTATDGGLEELAIGGPGVRRRPTDSDRFHARRQAKTNAGDITRRALESQP